MRTVLIVLFGGVQSLDVTGPLEVFAHAPGYQVADRAPLRDIQHWIAEHPAADLSVETLAQRASLSPRQFARAFAAGVGMPPGRCVGQARLEAARRPRRGGPLPGLYSPAGATVIFCSERPHGVCDESGALTMVAEAAYADVPGPDISCVPGGPGQAPQHHKPRRPHVYAKQQGAQARHGA